MAFFSKTVRLRCDFPDCKDARERRDYSITTMEEHMANHFLCVRPNCKQYIHQYACSCGMFFATHYHFTVHLYEFKKDRHQPLTFKPQWSDKEYLDAQSYFHTKFLPLYVIHVPFPKTLRVPTDFPPPSRVINGEDIDADDYRSRRGSTPGYATPGNATPGSFSLSRHASPSRSPHRGHTPIRQTRQSSPNYTQDSAQNTTAVPFGEEDRRPQPVSSANNSVGLNSSSTQATSSFSLSKINTKKRKQPTVQEETPSYLIAKESDSQISDISEQYRYGNHPQSMSSSYNYQSSLNYGGLPASRTCKDLNNGNFSKRQYNDKEAPYTRTEKVDHQHSGRSYNHPERSSQPQNFQAYQQTVQVPHIQAMQPSHYQAAIVPNNLSTNDLPSTKGSEPASSTIQKQQSNEPSWSMHTSDNPKDQVTVEPYEYEGYEAIHLRQNSKSSYQPSKTNTCRRMFPIHSLSADDESRISNFRPRNSRPEKPKLVTHPPFMENVPFQGARTRTRTRSRSRSRSRSCSRSRNPVLRS